jgi:hypothetical protein
VHSKKIGTSFTAGLIHFFLVLFINVFISRQPWELAITLYLLSSRISTGYLPDLQTKIEERADNADRGDQLRPGIDCFQTHIVSLANDRQGAEVKSGLAGGSPSLNWSVS